MVLKCWGMLEQGESRRVPAAGMAGALFLLGWGHPGRSLGGRWFGRLVRCGRCRGGALCTTFGAQVVPDAPGRAGELVQDAPGRAGELVQDAPFPGGGWCRVHQPAEGPPPRGPRGSFMQFASLPLGAAREAVLGWTGGRSGGFR